MRNSDSLFGYMYLKCACMWMQENSLCFLWKHFLNVCVLIVGKCTRLSWYKTYISRVCCSEEVDNKTLGCWGGQRTQTSAKKLYYNINESSSSRGNSFIIKSFSWLDKIFVCVFLHGLFHCFLRSYIKLLGIKCHLNYH